MLKIRISDIIAGRSLAFPGWRSAGTAGLGTCCLSDTASAEPRVASATHLLPFRLSASISSITIPISILFFPCRDLFYSFL